MLSTIEIYVIEKVKEARVSRNISQAELAHNIDVSPGFIGKVESLRLNAKYNLNHINKIASFLGLNPQHFLPEQPL